MDTDLKRYTSYLRDQGIDKVGHTNKTYMAHLVGLYRLLQEQGCSDEVCRAGLFHSIYGTEMFQGFKLPLERRPEVRQLIGARAEWLAYLNCAMDRSTFDRAVATDGESYTVRDRLTDRSVSLTRADFDDLVRIHLYDWLEQVGRSQMWDHRRSAYRGMAERLGDRATEAYHKVFAEESAGAGQCQGAST